MQTAHGKMRTAGSKVPHLVPPTILWMVIIIAGLFNLLQMLGQVVLAKRSESLSPTEQVSRRFPSLDDRIGSSRSGVIVNWTTSKQMSSSNVSFGDASMEEEQEEEGQFEDPNVEEAEVSKCLKSVQNSSSAWFQQRYNPDIPLFLTSEHLVEWARLSAERMPYGLKGLTEDDAHRVLGPLPKDDHWTWVNNFHDDQDRPVCLRCALVGDSAAPIGAGRGQEIDEHDLVIRVGDAEGHPDDVGMKTNLYLYNPELPLHTGKFKKHADVYYIYLASKVPDYHLISKLTEEKAQNSSHGSSKRLKVLIKPQQLRVLHPDFLNYVYELWLERAGHRATSEQVMLVLALHICDHVDTYGFGDAKMTSQLSSPEIDLQSLHHDTYRTDGMTRPVYNHLYEKKLRRKMVQEGLVQMFMQ